MDLERSPETKESQRGGQASGMSEKEPRAAAAEGPRRGGAGARDEGWRECGGGSSAGRGAGAGRGLGQGADSPTRSGSTKEAQAGAPSRTHKARGRRASVPHGVWGL